jgi:hypothetical protein
MRYALLIVDSDTANPSPEPPDPAVAEQVMNDYNAYTQMLRERGAYQAGEALQPNPTATTVRVQDGRTVTTDGPFVEAKEALGGFYIVEARDLDEAIEFAAACPGARFGAIEIRPIWEVPSEADMATEGRVEQSATA